MFKHYCNCGGYAAPMNGRDPEQPHRSWCAQLSEWLEWKKTQRTHMDLKSEDVVMLRKDAHYWKVRAATDGGTPFMQHKSALLTRAADVYQWVLDTQNEVEREQSAGS